MCELPAGDVIVMFGADSRVCSTTRVRLWDRLEACGVGGTTSTGRCKGVSRRGGRGDVGWACLWCSVTPCDVRRLEMARLARIVSLLLLCLG